MTHYLKKVKCPICSSREIKKELDFKVKSESIKFFRCLTCSLVFNANKTKVSYGDKYYSRGKGGLLKKIEEVYVYASNLYKKSIIEANSQKKKGVRVLDIGSGSGAFLNTLGKNYRKEGVELVKPGKGKVSDDIKMHYTSIDRLKLKSGRYDVITMWHVIEHLDNSRKSLRVIRNLLKKKGILVLSTPNTNSLGYRLARDKWYHFDFPYHKIFFNKQTLLALAQQCDFEIKRFVGHPFEFPLDLFWSIVRSKKYLWLLAVYPFVKSLDEETLVCILKKK